jgi:hypothetical protein
VTTTDDAGRQRLSQYGMTDDELDLWFDLAALAGRFLQLPTLHPNERSETVVELHALQTRLLARPGLRAAGWPSTPG